MPVLSARQATGAAQLAAYRLRPFIKRKRVACLHPLLHTAGLISLAEGTGSPSACIFIGHQSSIFSRIAGNGRGGTKLQPTDDISAEKIPLSIKRRAFLRT